MIDVQQITNLHREMVLRWHQWGVDNPYDDGWGIICTQHSYNFLLWHQEDMARSPRAGSERIAHIKQTIDRYNQQRNDWIEKIDDWLANRLRQHGIGASADRPLNTETPGSVIDRLSILALRIYHLQQQSERADVPAQHVEGVQRKLAICQIQQADLSQSLAELLADILAGRKRHKTYRQLKMYNDPALNPYLKQDGTLLPA